MTYSVAALDQDAGIMGVAVQSHWLAVGAIVPWAAAGTGVLATQANSDLAAGRRGLQLLAGSRSAAETLAGLLRDGPRAAVSQIAVLDTTGHAAAHTGGRCVAEAGHRVGAGWSVQANMMLRPTVPDAMAAAWAEGAGVPLEARMLAVLRAAQAEGGDVRGQQSAAMLIVNVRPAGPLDTILDVRIDDSADPLAELERLCSLGEAYREHELGLGLLATDPGRALAHWTRAAALAPGHEELEFWRAIALASAGQRAEARQILLELFQTGPRWRSLLPRLPAAGLLPDDPGLLAELLVGCGDGRSDSGFAAGGLQES
jgi:uncharacterized Ntn-hydrolase superfamily protein